MACLITISRCAWQYFQEELSSGWTHALGDKHPPSPQWFSVQFPSRFQGHTSTSVISLLDLLSSGPLLWRDPIIDSGQVGTCWYRDTCPLPDWCQGQIRRLFSPYGLYVLQTAPRELPKLTYISSLLRIICCPFYPSHWLLVLGCFNQGNWCLHQSSQKNQKKCKNTTDIFQISVQKMEPWMIVILL